LPWGTAGFEQADHQAAALFADVRVRRWVFEHRPGRIDLRHLLGDQVVVLGGLQRHLNAGKRSDLTAPHAGAIDHVLTFDRPLIGDDPSDSACGSGESGGRHTFDNRDAAILRPARE
jgi:hypothetical protein